MKKSLSKLAKQYHLQMIILFGSVARQRSHSASDVDLAILPQKPLTLKRELALRHALFTHFNREIDLVILPCNSPLLLGQIAREGQLLYGPKNDFLTFRVNAMKRFIDFKPYFALREQILRKKLA